jgi:peptide/nickel transport system ATP-binding protein
MMSDCERNTIILEIRSLRKYFPIEKGFFRRKTGDVRAVDDVNLTIQTGETVGLVGESGCGKTTLGRCVIKLYHTTAGEILYRGKDGSVTDLAKLSDKEMIPFRKDLQIIFQDPYSSLDPRMTVLDIIGEPLIYLKDKNVGDRVKKLVEEVGLEIKHLNRYPHAFSGGQRQRIGIARALATRPRFIVADEAVSALDMSIQAQIINLLKELQREYGLTFLFISHDLSVVQHICDKVAVMYVGIILEFAETVDLFSHPRHPYTEALLSAVPTLDLKTRIKRIILPGDVANPADPPSGCYFHPRCTYCKDICRKAAPPWEEIKDGHFVACHRAREFKLKGVY